jgi:secreted trypsin-like serine protease
LKLAKKKCPDYVNQDNQFCAGVKKGKKKIRDTCSGDSGGPLVSREYTDDPWTQIGIRSDPLGKTCKKEAPGIKHKVKCIDKFENFEKVTTII